MKKPLILRPKNILFPVCLFCFYAALAQVDPDKIFEASKGTWKYPTAILLKVEKYNPKFDVDSKSISFLSGKSFNACALIDGTVMGSVRSDDGFILVFKYGDYEIFYGGLVKASFKKGDYLKSGQVISLVQKNSVYKSCRLEITLKKNSEELNPAPWFKNGGQ